MSRRHNINIAPNVLKLARFGWKSQHERLLCFVLRPVAASSRPFPCRVTQLPAWGDGAANGKCQKVKVVSKLHIDNFAESLIQFCAEGKLCRENQYLS
jgi:hypothetical protein